MNKRSIAARLVALQRMDSKELKALWQELYGKPAPFQDNRMLCQQLAHRIQELAFGNHQRAQIDKRLEQAGKHSEHRKPLGKKRQIMPPLGTVICKEYNGEKHEVTVTPQGLEYRGQVYSSLTRIANLITGTQWSGPLFFGVKGRNYEK
ncbi:DUF2924 domain-containing protein [Endozoicomonas sp. Mp262]|uniref:DUF2924 domain-containing protein n=1 Tax=Endozoicomonas sp. Mp262 TaxID=2919499 RepID=UPI0021D93122